MQAGELLAGHGTHAAILLGPLLLLCAVGIAGDARTWLARRGIHVSTLLLVASGLSLTAAAIHGVVCPEHFREATLYGTFFLVATVGQLLWAGLVVVRPEQWLLRAGLASNAAVAALWALTRTVGIPLGPERGEVEPVGLLDLLSTGCEVGVVFACAWLLLRERSTGAAVAA